MVSPPSEKKTKGLPGLSRTSQLVLVVGIFLILLIPTYFIYQQQPQRHQQLATTLANLEKALAVETTGKSKLEAEIEAADEALQAVKAQYPSTSLAPEIADRLFNLARDNGITVTQCKTSVSKKKVGEGQGALDFPVLVFEMVLKGQVPGFQNFLIAVDGAFPTAQFKQVAFTIPEQEEAEHTASITLEMLCLPAGEGLTAEKGK